MLYKPKIHVSIYLTEHHSMQDDILTLFDDVILSQRQGIPQARPDDCGLRESSEKDDGGIHSSWEGESRD